MRKAIALGYEAGSSLSKRKKLFSLSFLEYNKIIKKNYLLGQLAEERSWSVSLSKKRLKKKSFSESEIET